MSEPTLLERLDRAEHALRAALDRDRPAHIVNALSALCSAAAARAMVGVEDIADGPAPLHEYPPEMHDGTLTAMRPEDVLPAAEDEDNDIFRIDDRPIIGVCSKCGEPREDDYTCREGGRTVPKEAGPDA